MDGDDPLFQYADSGIGGDCVLEASRVRSLPCATSARSGLVEEQATEPCALLACSPGNSGGLEQGLSGWAHKTALLCEIDNGARAVLLFISPEAALHADVTDRKASRLPEGVNLLAAGFPCQDRSQAGQTAGIEGRSLRWLPMSSGCCANIALPGCCWRTSRSCCTSRVVGLWIKWSANWRSSAIGGPTPGLSMPWHSGCLSVGGGCSSLRRRWGTQWDALFADECPEPMDSTRTGPPRLASTGLRGIVVLVGPSTPAPTLKGGSGLGIPSPPKPSCCQMAIVVTPSLGSAERLQGFPVNWTEAAEQKSRADTDGAWVVGNAVSVRAAQWLGERLACPGSFDASRLDREVGSTSWPTAACNLGEGRRAVTISEWPKRHKVTPLTTFLDNARPLSARATEGFAFRAEAGGQAWEVEVPSSVLERLRAHIESVGAAPV